MPDTLCVIHSVPMRQFWKKDDPDHKGQSWFSHKLDDGSWCNGTPKPARSANGYTQPAPKAEPQVDWDKIAVGKVASNLAVALIESGKTITEVQSHLEEIFKLANSIVEGKNSDLPF